MPDITKCPHCGSTDLDQFENEAGTYCYGCSSNVFTTDQDEIRAAIDTAHASGRSYRSTQ